VASGDPRNDLEKILQDLMKDIYYAEKKLSKALGKMAKNATEPKLKEAFTTHQTQTEDQIAKLEKAFGLLGVPPKAKKCAAIDGLLEESNEHIEEYAKGAGLDAAMIVGAQKVEHYEIAAYGSMRSFARTLGYNDVAIIFEQIREQESDTDELLTVLAESVINLKAEGETEDVSERAKSAAVGHKTGSEDTEAGEDSSSSYSGREGGDDALAGDGMMNDDGETANEQTTNDADDMADDSASNGDEDIAISSLTDGSDREGESETGEAMGY
jgi:ferritin-like metal-binding protein YciE